MEAAQEPLANAPFVGPCVVGVCVAAPLAAVDAAPVEIALRDEVPPRRRPWRPILACLASALAHLGLLVALAALLLPSVKPPDETRLAGSWDALPDDVGPDVAFSAASSRSSAEADLPQAVFESASTPGSSGWQAAPVGNLDVSRLLAQASRGDSAGLAAGRGKGDGPGDGDGSPGGAGPPATFFGIPLPSDGRKFAFVVDASGSMDGKRFERARRELLYTLRRLGSDCRFYVVFFNEYDFPQFHPHRTREYLPATPENIERVQKWAAQFRPAGNTHPMPAIRKALELRPDAIYFLSDGDFPGRTLELIRQFNASKTVIHTIGLEDPAGEALLREIARSNDGRYEFVP